MVVSSESVVVITIDTPSSGNSSLIAINVGSQLPLKLTPSNFPFWRSQLTSLLIGYDLQGYIDDTTICLSRTISPSTSFASSSSADVSNPIFWRWLKQDKLILHAILVSVSEPVISFIATSTTAHDAWSKLQRLYTNRSRTHVIQIKVRVSLGLRVSPRHQAPWEIHTLNHYPNKSLPQQITHQVEDENASTFTCEICIEPITTAARKFNNGGACAHPFCSDCIAQYVRVTVYDNGVAEIRCPGLDCRLLLDPLACRRILSAELFVKWCDLLCERVILGLEKCYCPYADCSALIIDECGGGGGGGRGKRWECPGCRKAFCFRCKARWHAGYRCREIGDVRDANDVVFGELMERKKWVRCPVCGRCVERRSGCFQIRCRCGTDFCYKCGEKISRSGCGCTTVTAGCRLVSFGISFIFIFFLFYLSFVYCYHKIQSKD
ncbi:E3 ubiquitin-protein ligase RSL1-like [Malania oleifera]|uniref:E3 ubiquitin-protein ligase RSL1-like n=1 Tax=Malania oleifera TaxID=397392 RepID=UPI0025AE73AD|nr:E3 ubiquitin-protein ligase RSL1-like [Malania oleifera]